MGAPQDTRTARAQTTASVDREGRQRGARSLKLKAQALEALEKWEPHVVAFSGGEDVFSVHQKMAFITDAEGWPIAYCEPRFALLLEAAIEIGLQKIAEELGVAWQ